MAKIDWNKVKVVDISEVSKDAKQVHLYEFSNVLRPRGPMIKESIGLHIAEQLINYYQSWTDPKYCDNPDELEQIYCETPGYPGYLFPFAVE